MNIKDEALRCFLARFPDCGLTRRETAQGGAHYVWVQFGLPIMEMCFGVGQFGNEDTLLLHLTRCANRTFDTLTLSHQPGQLSMVYRNGMKVYEPSGTIWAEVNYYKQGRMRYYRATQGGSLTHVVLGAMIGGLHDLKGIDCESYN